MMNIEFNIANLNAIAAANYEQNVEMGWWDDQNRCIYTTIQLIVTEVAEATEGERKKLQDDHLPHRKMGEVELADGLIRTLDLGGKFRDVLYITAEAQESFAERHAPTVEHMKTTSVGYRHLGLTALSVDFANAYSAYVNDPQSIAAQHNFRSAYTDLVFCFVIVADAFGYDIFSAMKEKIEYNRTRKDHSREERKKEHGKEF